MARAATRATGYHQVDTAYERSFEAYSRGLTAPVNRDTVRRACGCVQNFTLRPRCFDCPAVKAGEGR
jgi:hypothetical protein